MADRNSPTSTTEAPSSPPAWSRGRRALISALLLLHFFAVFAAPMSGPPPSSELSRSAVGVVEWYIQALFLGHGYRFFAPNPGPSHVVRYELIMSDGTVKTGQFPDRDEHWPRLLYHRHFMISETINGLTSIPPREDFEAEIAASKQEIDILEADGHRRQAARLRAEIKRDQASYDEAERRQRMLIQGVARRLMLEHDAVGIRMVLREHLIPNPLDIEMGSDLNDEQYWQERTIVEFMEEAK